MTVRTSVLWKMNIHMAKKGPERSYKGRLLRDIHFETVFSRKTLLISTNLEVYSSIAVFIKDSKYLINKNFCVAHWKNHWVHVEYFVFAQFTVWTINLKKENLYWSRNKFESSAQCGPAKCGLISKRFLGWLQSLKNMPDTIPSIFFLGG